MRSSGQPQQVTTQRTDTAPWSTQQPYLEQGFKAAEQLAQTPREFFPGQTFVGPTASDIASTEAIKQRALTGSPIIPEAQQQYQSTIGGDFLGAGNPAYDAMVERAINPLRREFEETIRPGIRGGFSRAGRSSNIASEIADARAAENYARSVGDVTAQLAYPTYEAERARMFGGLGQAGGMAGLDYVDPTMLAGVGETERGFLGQPLQEQIARYNFEQEEEADRLARYMGFIGGGYGSSGLTTTTAPQTFKTPFLGALGGGLAGATMGSMEGMPGGALPWTIGGGLLGALA